jgi:hypothetical protein
METFIFCPSSFLFLYFSPYDFRFFFVLILKLHFSSRLISLILKDKKESHKKKKGERGFDQPYSNHKKIKILVSMHSS